jgi:hypothetical protein
MVDSPEAQFKVVSPDFAVFELGTASAREYEIEVKAIVRPVPVRIRDGAATRESRVEVGGKQSWGLVFGLREHPELSNGLQVLEFEMITINVLSQDEYELRRSRVVYKRAEQKPAKPAGSRDAVPSDPPTQRSRETSLNEAEESIMDQGSIRVRVRQMANGQTEPMALRILFQDAQLTSVTLNEREWPELRGDSEQPGSAELRGIPGVGKYPLVGRFGVVAEHAQVDFLRGRYRYLFDPR